MAAGANGPMKYVGLTKVQSVHQEPRHETTAERLTPSDADIRVCLSNFNDSPLSQSLRGGVNVERLVTRESLFPSCEVPIYQVLVSAATVNPSETCNLPHRLQ